MQNHKFILLIALSVSFASCAPTNLGFFSADDLSSYRNNNSRIASYRFNPGHLDLLGRGRVEMTGMYSLQNARTAGLTELGQIDLVIDFSDREDTGSGSFKIPIVEGRISRVTGLIGERVPEFGVGWDGTLPITGSVFITEPVGASRTRQRILFEAEGTLTQISRDDDGVSQRLAKMSFDGAFVQRVESGHFLLSAVGQTLSTNGQSDFYLEQVGLR